MKKSQVPKGKGVLMCIFGNEKLSGAIKSKFWQVWVHNRPQPLSLSLVKVKKNVQFLHYLKFFSDFLRIELKLLTSKALCSLAPVSLSSLIFYVLCIFFSVLSVHAVLPFSQTELPWTWYLFPPLAWLAPCHSGLSLYVLSSKTSFLKLLGKACPPHFICFQSWAIVHTYFFIVYLLSSFPCRNISSRL